MPSGRTHFAAGAILSGYALYTLGGPTEYLLAGALAGLAPDMDHKKAMLGRYNLLNRVKVPVRRYGKWKWKSIMKHRGFTHSILALLGSYILSLTVNDWFAISVLVGYGSHILLDYLTPMGVQLLWPKKKYYSIRR